MPPKLCKLSLCSAHEDKLSEIIKTSPLSRRHVVRFMISALLVRLQSRCCRKKKRRRKKRREREEREDPSLCGALRADRMNSGSASAGLPPPRRLVLHVPVWSCFWSDVSPPSVFWERMRLLVFATLFGVLLDAGRVRVGETVEALPAPKNKCFN